MKALLLIDIQIDFLPGGALAVAEGDRIIPIVNELQKRFELVVATQDWHPSNHGSFAVNHPGKKPGERIELNGLEQILWPAHCIQNSKGAELAPEVDQTRIQKVIQKGTDPKIDSYSGFYDNGHLKSTGLERYLTAKRVTDLYIAGLATDYCVKFTALDALPLNFKTYVVEDACRGVNLKEGDVSAALEEMQEAGVHIVQSRDLLKAKIV
jgi:nicotinamidase/pyrazinamidase